MRQHPISPVTEPTQYRAIGVVRGVYVPTDAEQLTRGVIRTADGTELEAVVLGRLLTLMRRHLNLEEPHLWVVYPRSREEEGLHLQMVGVWEPSTLAAGEETEAPAEEVASTKPVATESAADALPEGDDYFSVRGELIYTRPETGDLVVKVRVMPRPDGSKPVPFKLQLKGELPLEHLRHFVALNLRRQGQLLQMESFEVIGPVAQRGNRGGKGRRDGGSANKGGKGGKGRPPAASQGGGHTGGQRNSAVSRPAP
ncbi:hypothetical protein KBY65_01775 [Cyanobium sp. Alchichica 3B3-8F6]|uniref:hypothetical protein n=1 Tax=unclassified Cyanobium TaxID=2627006 RepID=UPI0020CF0FC7|nr:MULTISPECIES: hypothetical protein [unclassified Cyanobium]MCP9881209.1 hypothetical protein [Cyanobium sp. Alchichica 3B3-8F6]MCP9941836.1 hypothetical protein [Cyanobium sp. ATX 6E8]